MLGYKSSTGGGYRLDSRAGVRQCKPCRMATSSSGILVSVRWPRSVCQLFDRKCDPTPDGRTILISLGLKLVPRRSASASVVLGVAFARRSPGSYRERLADLRFELLDHKKLDFKSGSAQHSFGLKPRG